MAYTIQRSPLKWDTIVGQKMVYTVFSTNANQATKYKYKYVCYLYIGDTGSATQLVATLKASPNDNGYGIFTIDGVLEDYLKSDNNGFSDGTIKSKFKNMAFNDSTTYHPIHVIDKFCLNTNSLRNFYPIFKEEYATTPTGPVATYSGAQPAAYGKVFNGVDYGLEQKQSGGNYGVVLSDWNDKDFTENGGGFAGSTNLLTDAPFEFQYIGDYDYHTISFLAGAWGKPQTQTPISVTQFRVQWFDINNNSISSFFVTLNTANGGYNGSTNSSNTNTSRELQYFGCGVANFRNTGVAIPSNWHKYQVTSVNSFSTNTSPKYNFIKQNDDCKGYEKIRLTWLNKYGTWDYYNFTKKSIKSTNIKRDEFKGIKGNWNNNRYTQHDANRGRTILNTKATKVIQANSDWFTTDEEAAWLEQLFISNEVYILKGFDDKDTGTSGAEFGKYITPCIVKSNKYEKYTQANDKVAQYEITIEEASNMRIQKG